MRIVCGFALGILAAPFDRVVRSFGIIPFADVPGLWSIAGAAVIVAGSLPRRNRRRFDAEVRGD